MRVSIEAKDYIWQELEVAVKESSLAINAVEGPHRNRFSFITPRNTVRVRSKQSEPSLTLI
ncbi:hypothetical protein RSAG8_03231, partial [Rhizoctonia solani AG-8 WAC10335]